MQASQAAENVAYFLSFRAKQGISPRFHVTTGKKKRFLASLRMTKGLGTFPQAVRPELPKRIKCKLTIRNSRRDASALSEIRSRAHGQRRGDSDANVLGLAARHAFRRDRKFIRHCGDRGISQRPLARPSARTVRRLDIVAFGRDFASITLEFERTVSGKIISGRQSQVWVRLPEGWRIVSAHVSVL